jgi:hypothetical protein
MANENLMAIIDKALETYKVGGEFSKQRGTQLETARKKFTTSAQASLAGRGLSGTTIAASINPAFEQEIGAQFRTETERLRSGQEMQGLLAKAGFLEAEEERQLRRDLADKQSADQRFSASMDAASRVHGGGGGGGGGGSTGGGSAASMISAWRSQAPISRGGTGTQIGGARQHTGEGGGGFRGSSSGTSTATGVWQVNDQTGKLEQIAKPKNTSTEYPEWDAAKGMSYKLIPAPDFSTQKLYSDGSKSGG